MGRTAQEYLRQLQSLLPKGRFWSRDNGAVLTELLYGLAEEYSRVEERSEDLITEQDVRNTTELITEHEEDYGLPEEGLSLGDTLSERRNSLYAKLLTVGRQNKEYFIEIALALGWTITITEFTPSLAGLITAGEELGGENVIFWWRVNIDYDYNDKSKVNIIELINSINRFKPAHTQVIYQFYNVEFSNAFSNDFNAVPWWDASWEYSSFDRNFSDDFANAYEYNGVNLTGAFDHSFNINFDRHSGGDFEFNAFSDDFYKIA